MSGLHSLLYSGYVQKYMLLDKFKKMQIKLGLDN